MEKVYTTSHFSKNAQASRRQDDYIASVVSYAEPILAQERGYVDSFYVSPAYLETYAQKLSANLAKNDYGAGAALLATPLAFAPVLIVELKALLYFLPEDLPAFSAAVSVEPVSSLVMVAWAPFSDGTIVTTACATSIPLATLPTSVLLLSLFREPAVQLVHGHAVVFADVALTVVARARIAPGLLRPLP